MSGGEQDKKPSKVKEPEGMVRYDPDKPAFQRLHVCVLLLKVNDALNGEVADLDSDEESPY